MSTLNLQPSNTILHPDLKKRCVIVQQGVWHMSKESMPLAAGYIVAGLRADPDIESAYHASIENFSGVANPLQMALRIVDGGVPDVVGFSVLGWNYNQFIKVAETLKQFNPNCLIVFGGSHISYQAQRVFGTTQAVDIVVNGEGDFVLRDLLKARLKGYDLRQVQGISYLNEASVQIDTTPRNRIQNLDEIPSPILSGAIALTNENGEFKYDVALMETNRGCPYSCSFCYWGGATGQKVRAFSIGRLRQELELLVEAGAETVVLCDANFGILKQDLEFVEAVIDLKAKFGRPKALETSWAKNKNKVFYEIVERMKSAGLQSSFTIALQSTSEPVLESMQRKNMKINDWKDLVSWLRKNEMDVYAELIWGAPGETYESFLEGYDEMARHVSRIATYPILLLPNTEYGDNIDTYGFKTIKGAADDFDYVLQSNSATLVEHRAAWRFLFWARLLAENLVFRNIWLAADKLENIRQSELILSFAEYIEETDELGAQFLKELSVKSVADPDSLAPALEFCFVNDAFEALAIGWWDAKLSNLVSEANKSFFKELLLYDLDTRPLRCPSDRGFENAISLEDNGVEYWEVEKPLEFPIPDLVSQLSSEEERIHIKPSQKTLNHRFRFRKGFEDLVRSTNHEETAHYVASVVCAPTDVVAINV